MSETIVIDELVFSVKRSKRRRTVGVTLERDKSLVAHLPQEVAIDEASKLIASKLLWVYQKLAEQSESARADVFRVAEFVDGEGFHLLGKHYRLKLVDVPENVTGVPSIRFEGDRLLLRREQAASGGKRIEEYYTRAAHPYLNEAVQRWKRIVGAEPGRFVQVMDLGYRWGSCSADGTLNFHWRIMQLPPRIIEYIVVHELVHIKVPNHSDKFWATLGSVMPDFESRRVWLRNKAVEL
ncbi:M48 family metallopeptidase [Cereibacter changlensis]|uniref:M48 family metallopeptidase n=1 Tax=Cereibacter changlensis TaxID=402884 RepID=A0A4U0Z542_9RHOB|nr:SprT family zinc-dependent metalloprotease [Cereibacter changlensis]TKA98386.1 M48 family metallopeptidase [Cereibacter changlensis]